MHNVVIMSTCHKSASFVSQSESVENYCIHLSNIHILYTKPKQKLNVGHISNLRPGDIGKNSANVVEGVELTELGMEAKNVVVGGGGGWVSLGDGTTLDFEF